MERKKAIITGASRGIGRGIALALAQEGYDLAISYATQEDRARELAGPAGGRLQRALPALPGIPGQEGGSRGFF